MRQRTTIQPAFKIKGGFGYLIFVAFAIPFIGMVKGAEGSALSIFGGIALVFLALGLLEANQSIVVQRGLLYANFLVGRRRVPLDSIAGVSVRPYGRRRNGTQLVFWGHDDRDLLKVSPGVFREDELEALICHLLAALPSLRLDHQALRRFPKAGKLLSRV